MVQNIYNTSVRKRFLVIKLIIIIHIPRLHSPEALFFYLQKTYFYCCFTRSKVAFLIALCLFLLLSARINEKEMTRDCKYNFRINELPDKRTFGHINLKTTDFGLSIRFRSNLLVLVTIPMTLLHRNVQCVPM